jgi:hypothetical protein
VAYTFDPTSGDPRSMLAERVVFNSFSSTRYAEFVKRALNDAVTAICRRLEQNEAYEVLSYAGATGAVADPVLPWFRIDEVWSASATAAASGEVAFASVANYPLQPIDDHVLGTMTPTSPLYYIVRRRKSPTGFVPKLDLIIATPPAAGGFVAVRGLQRPAVMDADGVVTGLGADLDGAVVAYAKARCFDNEDDFDAADRWTLRYETRLREAIEGGVQVDGPDVVEGTWSC